VRINAVCPGITLTEHVSQARALATILLYNVVSFSVELGIVAVAALAFAFRPLDAEQDFALAQRNTQLLVSTQQFRIDLVEAFRSRRAFRRGGARSIFRLRRDRRQRRRFDRGLLESALEFVQRHFARTQLALQGLCHDRALRGRLDLRWRRSGRGGFFGRSFRMRAVLGHQMQLRDQVLVVAFRFGFGRFQLGQQVLDAVDADENEADGLSRHRHAVAKFAHQCFAGMRQRF